MAALLQDLRYALRAFTKSPTFSAVAVATLALGIGANAAIFALVDRVLIRTLPVVNPGELVLLRSPGPKQGRTSSDGDDAFCFSYPTYRELKEQSKVFAGLIGEVPFSASIAARGETERAAGELVTGNYFGVLGVPPALGRILTPADDESKGAHPVAVLSHGYWQRRFGGDPSVIDKPVIVNGQSFTIVGVSAKTFEGIQAGRRADLFVPMMMKPQITPFWDGLDDPKDYWLQIVGRLKPGFSRSAAEHELVATYRPILEQLLPRMTGWNDVRKKEFLNKKIELLSGARGRRTLQQGYGAPLASLMGMVGLVLLIACSNLAGLLAARGAARQREYGIRLAIGASRAQLLRQSIVECLVFSVVGGALGLLLAAWLLNGLLSAFPADADLRQVAAQIDPRVLAFGAALSLRRGHPLRRRSRVPRRAAGPRADAARAGPRFDDPGTRSPAPAQRPRHRPGRPDARPARGGRPLHAEFAQPLPGRARREGGPGHRILPRAETERLHLRAHRRACPPADRRPQGPARRPLGHRGRARDLERQRHGQQRRPGGRRHDGRRPPYPHEPHRSGLLRHARDSAARGACDHLGRRRQRAEGLRRQRDLREKGAARQARHRPADRNRGTRRQAGYGDRRRGSRQQGLPGQRGAGPLRLLPVPAEPDASATSTSTSARRGTRRASPPPCARRSSGSIPSYPSTT